MLPSHPPELLPQKEGPRFWNRRTLKRKAAGREKTSEMVAELPPPPSSKGSDGSDETHERRDSALRRHSLSRFVFVGKIFSNSKPSAPTRT